MSSHDESSHWHRVADLRPRLRPGVRLHRHRYRGRIWYVLRGAGPTEHFRLDAGTRAFVKLMDGQRSVADCVARIGAGDHAPTRDEVVQLLAALYQAGVLDCDVSPDVDALLGTRDKRRRTRRAGQLANPLAIRIPLFDPERGLRAMTPLAQRLFGGVSCLLWLILAASGLVSAAAYWPGIAERLDTMLLDPRAWVLALVVYPLVKGLHELAHALAVKARGGEVHEVGVMLLVLLPLPYVDASAAWGFADKRDRMLVAAAGVLAELGLAAIALGVWLNVEPGLIADLAFQVMVIGSVSTVLFNGNPLLRFDGYFVLADALEIPNLATRSRAFLGYLARRYLLGLRGAESPVSAAGESAWLFGYGIASAAYRVALTLAIALFVAGSIPMLGVALAAWALVGQLLWPLLKMLKYLATAPETEAVRGRALTLLLVTLLLPSVAVTAVDVPVWTRAEGVVWAPEGGQVRTESGGFVRAVRVEDGAQVEAGQVLLELDDPEIAHRIEVLRWKRRELEIRRSSVRMSDPVAASKLDDELAATAAELAELERRLAALAVRSPMAGRLVMSRVDDLTGRWLDQGAALGFVVDANAPRARVVVTQDEVARVRGATERVRVRVVDDPRVTHRARVEREVPAASQQLPSGALGARGGGRIEVDVRDRDGLATLQPVFQFELALPPEAATLRAGTRVLARFEHPAEPLARQWERAIRQLLLTRLSG